MRSHRLHSPTGGPCGQNARVVYAPQAVHNRDTANRGEGNAITRREALKATNPWQENERIDIALFHELVHAHHVQDKSLLDKDDLVDEEDVVHKADAPFMGSGMAEGQRIGVSKNSTQWGEAPSAARG